MVDSEPNVIGRQAVEEFRGFKIRLREAQLSRAEQEAGMEWCLEHKQGGEAKYEE